MIAEGIYNPVTGETVKVQGAGSVYNEEKNSVAVGKDTVASGQDQFVFGCKNAIDIEKVEIVGGGRKIAIEGLVHLSDYNDDKNRHARAVFSLPVDRENYDFSADSDVPSRVVQFAENGNYTKKLARIDEFTIEDNLTDIYNFYYIGQNSGTYGEYWYFYYIKKDGSMINPVGDQFDTVRGFTKSFVSGSTGKNIRTLDWSGNEKLAGGLEIGGSLKIGSTTITEAQLQALLAIITESES